MFKSLNYAFLTEALNALKDGEIRRCEAMGFTYTELEAINNLSLEELFSLCRDSAGFLNIHIDHDTLRRLLSKVRDETEWQMRVSRAVALGGSIEMLSQFFGLSSGEVCSRRRFVGVNVAQGRNPMPDEETDTQIWQLWQARHPGALDTMEAIDVMMDITEKLSADREEVILLNVVWNRIVLNESHRPGRVING